MTKPIKREEWNELRSRSEQLPRLRVVKPSVPLPPPPNPNPQRVVQSVSVDSALLPDRQAYSPEAETTAPFDQTSTSTQPAQPTASSPTDFSAQPERATSSDPYDKLIQGPLTYFNVYYEDVNQFSVSREPDADATSSQPFKLSKTLVGAGVLAATVVSGLVIGDALQKPEKGEKAQSPDATLRKDAAKQDATSNLPRPTTATPERLQAPRSLSTTPANSPKPALKSNSGNIPVKPTQGKVDPMLAMTAAMPPLSTGVSQPTGLTNLPPLPSPKLPAAPRSLPTVQVQQTPIQQTPIRQTPAQLQTALQRLQNSSAISRPETLSQPGMLSSPSASDAGPVTGNPATANPSSNELPQSSGVSAGMPPQLLDPANSARLGNPAMNDPAIGNSGFPETRAMPPDSPPTWNQTMPSNDRSRDRSMAAADAASPGVLPALSTLAQPTTAQATVPQPTSPGATTAAKTLPQGIQDYLSLPQKATSQPVTTLPLTSQAATEAVSSKQVGPFAVRQVATQDYQKEWVASNPKSADPAIAYGFPAYGFIDYQRQLIVVLQDQPQTAPLQSQALTSPRS